jgi:hypothetical protein
MLEPIVPPPSASDAKGDVAASNVVINPIPPSIIGNLVAPVYPPAALASHAGECTIYATLTIDTRGMVSEVSSTWQRVNIPNAFSDEFIEAIRIAVKRWRFEPARNVYWEKDGSGDLKYMSTETRPSKIDIKFIFEATGRVR